MCVAKLFDISPELVRDQGFIDTLRDLISDANPSVSVVSRGVVCCALGFCNLSGFDNRYDFVRRSGCSAALRLFWS